MGSQASGLNMLLEMRRMQLKLDSTGGGLSAAKTGRWGAALALAFGSHPAPTLPSASRPHASNRYVLMEMRRRFG